MNNGGLEFDDGEVGSIIRAVEENEEWETSVGISDALGKFRSACTCRVGNNSHGDAGEKEEKEKGGVSEGEFEGVGDRMFGDSFGESDEDFSGENESKGKGNGCGVLAKGRFSEELVMVDSMEAAASDATEMIDDDST